MSAALFPDEAEIERLLVGPESVAWRVSSDARLQLAMLYPLLLQVAHPTVGAGVSDHSDFERRPWDRLLRTVDYVNLLVYGGRDAAAAGRRLRALHKHFRGVRRDGVPYYALEPGAYAWVHATLIETYVAGHARFGRPMTRAEVERFYLEYRGLGRLIGVREGQLPSDWDGFRRYFEGMIERELERTDAVERVLRSVLHLQRPPLPVPELIWRAATLPAARALWLGGVGLMPARLRRRLGIGWSVIDEAAFRGLGILSRRLDPVLPETLRVSGPGHLRWRSAEISAGVLGPGPRSRAAA